MKVFVERLVLMQMIGATASVQWVPYANVAVYTGIPKDKIDSIIEFQDASPILIGKFGAWQMKEMPAARVIELQP